MKVIPLDGVTPAADAIRGGSYPYARSTFYYTNGEPSGLTKQFVDFTLSDAGQKIATKSALCRRSSVAPGSVTSP